MKFEDFYKQVFIAEKDDEVRNNVASPDDFDDVEPIPAPELETDDTSSLNSANPETPAIASTGSNNLGTYLAQVQDFISKLNSPDGDCLNTLIKQLDKPGTPYVGITGKLNADVLRAVEALGAVEQNLIDYVLRAKVPAAPKQ